MNHRNLGRASGSVVVALAMLLAFTGQAGAAGWGGGQALGNWGSEAADVVALDDSTVVAGVTTYKSYLVVRGSTDGGRSWWPGVRIGLANGIADGHELAGDGLAVDAVWSQQRSGTETRSDSDVIWYARSTDRGRTFHSPVRLSDASGHSIYPDVAHDGSVVVVAWRVRSGDPEVPTYSVVSRASTDGGATFGPPVAIDAGPPGAYGIHPRLAIESGHVYLSYGVNGHRLRLRQSLDNGATWGPRTAITNHAARTYGNALAVDGAKVFVGFVTGTGEMLYRRSPDGGATWSRLLVISNKWRPGQPGGWSLTLNAHDGQLDAAFLLEDRAGWGFSLMYRHSENGTSWDRAAEVGGSMCSSPSLAHAAGRAILLCTQWNGGDQGRVTRAYVLSRPR